MLNFYRNAKRSRETTTIKKKEKRIYKKPHITKENPQHKKSSTSRHASHIFPEVIIKEHQPPNEQPSNDPPRPNPDDYTKNEYDQPPDDLSVVCRYRMSAEPDMGPRDDFYDFDLLN